MSRSRGSSAPSLLRRALGLLGASFLAFTLLVLAHMAPRPARRRVVKANVQHTQPPLGTLMIVLDVSGSMSGSKMAEARDAVQTVLDLQPADAPIGLRAFASQTGLVTRPGPGSAADLYQRIDMLDVGGVSDGRYVRGDTPGSRAPRSLGGGTSMADAMAAAGADLADAGEDGAFHWILVSDGSPNDAEKVYATARRLAREYPKLKCDTIGIEMGGHGAQVLEKVSQILRGKNWNVDKTLLRQTMVEAAGLGSLTAFERSNTATGIPSSSGSRQLPAAFAWILLVGGLVLAAGLGGASKETPYLVTLCVAAGAASWFAAELFLPHHGTSGAFFACVQSAAYFMVVAVILAVPLAAQEDLYLGNIRKAVDQALGAVPPAVFGGAFAGVLGQALFLSTGEAATAALVTVFTYRVLGWGLAGAVVGACPGVAQRSSKLVRDGAVGGGLGGLMGGALFEGAIRTVGTAGLPRLLALVSLAVAIAWMVRTVREMNKAAWFTIQKGGPEGKALLLSKDITTVGSHYQDDICVRATTPGQPQREALVIRRGQIWHVEALPDIPITVNDVLVKKSLLTDGDVLGIGSALLRFGTDVVSEEDAADPYAVLERIRPDGSLEAARGSTVKSMAPMPAPALPEDDEWVMDVIPANRRDDDDAQAITFLDPSNDPD